MTTLITSNGEMNNIMKIVKSLEDTVLLIKGVSETIQNEIKEQKGEFLSMLLGTLGASLLANLSTVKGVKYKIPEKEIMRAGEGTVRDGESTVRVRQDY